MNMNLPNKLTLFRIFLIPLFVIVMMINFKYRYSIACLIFIVASVTDYFDGMLARKYNLITNFGKFMDPLADKLLVLTAFICLVDVQFVAPWVVAIIVAREMTVSIIRAIAASDGKVIAAAKSGKIKTATQMVSIILVLIGGQSLNPTLLFVSQIFVMLAVFFTIYSGWEYIYNNREIFMDVN